MFIMPIIAALLVFIFIDQAGYENQNGPINNRQSEMVSLYGAAVGAAVGLVGSLVAVLFLNLNSFNGYVKHLPDYATYDVILTIYSETLHVLAAENQLMAVVPFMFVLVTTLAAGVLCFFLFYYREHLRRWVVWALLILVSLTFINSSLVASSPMRKAIIYEPPDYAYAFDALIYLKTFYRMADTDYYRANMQAFAKDARELKNPKIKNGKSYNFLLSPLYIRFPLIFYLWRILTGGKGLGIYFLGLAYSLIVLWLSYFAARKLYGNAGVFLSLMIMPYLFMGVSWWNLFFPDWWAALSLAAGVFLWMRKKYWPAAVFMLAAVLFRVVFLVFLLLFLGYALVKEKQARVKLLSALGVFLLIYPWHYIKAANFIVTDKSAVTSITSRFSTFNFLAATSYMAFPYGFFLWSPIIFMFIAMLAWAIQKRYDMLALSLLALPYFAFSSSIYWGQHLLLLILFGAFSILLIGMNKGQITTLDN